MIVIPVSVCSSATLASLYVLVVVGSPSAYANADRHTYDMRLTLSRSGEECGFSGDSSLGDLAIP